MNESNNFSSKSYIFSPLSIIQAADKKRIFNQLLAGHEKE